MKEYQFIQIEKKNDRTDVVLNRPPVNVLNIAMMRELCDAFTSLADEANLKVVVLRAEGKAFSAGVDVSEHTAEKVNEMITVFGDLFKTLFAIKAVTIAAVKGAALGGGCELAIGCDIVLASEKAKFGQPEVKVGVLPPIAAVLFPKLVGRNRAIEWLLSGKAYPAVEAEHIGLINAVYPFDLFDQKVDEFAAEFTSCSAKVLAITKDLLNRLLPLGVSEGAALADEIYLNQLMKTEDAHEGLAAFLEKRQPVWKNK